MAEVLLPIIAEIAIDAPAERVFETLTRHTPTWLGCLNYQLAEGATFHMQPDAGRRAAGDATDATECRIVNVKPPHKFDFTWQVPGAPETLVQVSVFSEGPDRSFVRLVHDGWDRFGNEDVRSFHTGLGMAWRTAVLPALKLAVESRG